MPKHKVTGYHNETVKVEGNGDTWIFDKNANVSTPNAAVRDYETIDIRIVVAGRLDGASGWAGIDSSGTNTEIVVGENGVVSGGYGIYSNGINTAISNSGSILGYDGNSAIYGFKYGLEIHNSGTIQSTDSYAIGMAGDHSLIVNEKDGKIIGGGGNSGIVMFQEFDGSSRTVNHGLIDGGYFGRMGDDVVVNDGRIRGYISLSGGDDTFDTRGGTIGDPVYGKRIDSGVGDDILITDNASYYFYEIDGEGEDIVRSTVSYALQQESFIERLQLIGKRNIDATGTDRGEELWGNAGNNVLTGLRGADELDGKAGNDMLRGGQGADTFIFSTGYDKDTIRSFVLNDDRVDVSGWKAMKNFADLKNNHADDHGKDVWITDGQDVLVIQDVNKTDLDAGFFIF